MEGSTVDVIKDAQVMVLFNLFSVAWQIGYKRTQEIVEASTVEQVIYDLYEPKKEVCGCEHI